MGSVYYGGEIYAKFEKAEGHPNAGGMDVYPFNLPELTVEGWVDDYLNRWFYTWMGENVILKREGTITLFKKDTHFKVRVKDEDGERLCEFDEVPSEYKYTVENDLELFNNYSVEVINLTTHKVKKYKMVFDKEVNMTEMDLKNYSGYKGELPYPKTLGPLTDEQIQTLVDNNEIETYKKEEQNVQLNKEVQELESFKKLKKKWGAATPDSEITFEESPEELEF